MPIDPKAVGLKGGPVRRSWTSKDALLYALGVGAGVDELAFTTENTKDTPQVGSSRVDLQACKLEYSIVSPK